MTTHDIHQMITELTRQHHMGTPYETDEGTRYHYIKVPALLVQLENAAPTSTGGANITGGGSKSQPPSHIEALDTIHHIDRAASAWVRALGYDDPSTTIACVTFLGSLYPSAGEHQQRDIARDVRSWWTQARVITGIDCPSWRPDNTCPLCGKRGTLRINVEGESGVCVECRESWDSENISLLAEHIKLENAEDDTEGDAA